MRPRDRASLTPRSGRVGQLAQPRLRTSNVWLYPGRGPGGAMHIMNGLHIAHVLDMLRPGNRPGPGYHDSTRSVFDSTVCTRITAVLHMGSVNGAYLYPMFGNPALRGKVSLARIDEHNHESRCVLCPETLASHLNFSVALDWTDYRHTGHLD